MVGKKGRVEVAQTAYKEPAPERVTTLLPSKWDALRVSYEELDLGFENQTGARTARLFETVCFTTPAPPEAMFFRE